MGVLLVVVAVVIAFLLWRLVRVQEARGRVEVAHTATQIARDFAQAFARGFEEARSKGRLIEWFEATMRELNVDDEDARLRLHTADGKDVLPLLVSESFERGVKCRFLDESDFRQLYLVHPGPEPTASSWCPENHCDQEKDVLLPAGLATCPFCGEPAENLETESELEEQRRSWQAEMQSFERFRRLFPHRANPDEAQSLTAHAAAAERDRKKFESLIAEQRNDRKIEELDVDVSD